MGLKPMKTIIRLEELGLFFFSIYLFPTLSFPWWVFPLLLFAPDLSMVRTVSIKRILARSVAMMKKLPNVLIPKKTLTAFILLCVFFMLTACDLSSVFGTDDCDKNYTSPQVVNIQPFVDMMLPSNTKGITKIVEDPFFDNYEIIVDGYYAAGYKSMLKRELDASGKNQKTYSDMTVHIWEGAEDKEIPSACLLTGPSETTYKEFVKNYQGPYIFGADGDTKYCISPVREDQADPEGNCHPLGYFYSNIVLFKGDVMVEIKEQTNTKEITMKDEFIIQFVQTIDEWFKTQR
jgi:hypothetical protein